jgi:hypothetical protein
MRTAHCSHRSITPRSAFAGFRFPSEVIVLAVRWHLRFGLMPLNVLRKAGLGCAGLVWWAGDARAAASDDAVWHADGESGDRSDS